MAHKSFEELRDFLQHTRLSSPSHPRRRTIFPSEKAFGFAMTNCVYLGYLADESAGGAVNQVYDVTGAIAEYQRRYTNVELEQSMIFLLTVGSFVHSVFDMSIWYLMACFCFRPGGACQGKSRSGDGGGGGGRDRRRAKCRDSCRNLGIYVAVLVVLAVVAGATAVAVVRLNEDMQRAPDTAAEAFADSQLLDGSDGEAGDGTTNKFAFLVGYALELVVALFVFYFITSTVFFSGLLGCGRIPILGGRPYEIWKEKRKERLGGDADEDEDAPGMLSYI